MPTFKIFHGASEPMRACGVNQCRLLSFAEKYRGWHSFGTDRGTIRAINALYNKGYLDVDFETKQFKFRYP